MLSVAAFHTTAGESNPYNTLTNLAFYIQNPKPWSQPDWFLSAVKNCCQICPISLLRVQYVWCLSFSAFLPKPSNRLAILFFFFSFFLFGLHPQKFPGQGSNQSSSASLRHNPGNAGSLPHWAGPGIKPTSSWVLAGFAATESRQGLQGWQFFIYFPCFMQFLIRLFTWHRNHSKYGSCSDPRWWEGPCFLMHELGRFCSTSNRKRNPQASICFGRFPPFVPWLFSMSCV